MQYWLMKSEPDVFGIDDLHKVGVEPWDGVRNYQARNMMRDQMQVGDQVFFYHSNCDVPGIVGIAEIATSGYPDDTACNPEAKYFDPKSDPQNPRWYRVDVKFGRKLKRTISLQRIPRPSLAGKHALGTQGLPPIRHAGHRARMAGHSRTRITAIAASLMLFRTRIRAASGCTRAKQGTKIGGQLHFLRGICTRCHHCFVISHRLPRLHISHRRFLSIPPKTR